ncbi:MAG: sugar phosphate isomerase/epimerase family protein [Chloroflexota bacterium]
MMKLGTAWFGFREQTPANYFEMAAALGLKYVEIPLYWHIIEDRHFRYSQQGIDTMRVMAGRVGVRMVSSVSALDIAGGFNSRGDDIDWSTVEFAQAAARRVIDLGVQLGVEVLRITEPNIPSERLDMARSHMEKYGQAMRALGHYGAERGVRIVVENYGLTSEQIKWLLDTADHPAVGTLYDPCNYHRIGEDPLSALKNLRECVYYCHLKDALRDDPRDPDSLFEGSRWAPSVAVGEGDIDWGPILAELATFYDGYLCIEYEITKDVMRGTRASIKHIRRVAAERNIDIKP